MRGKTQAITLAVAMAAMAAGCIPADSALNDAPASPPRIAEPRLDTDAVALIETQPVWTAQQVVADARPVAGSTYIVQAGDTLRGIGNRTGAGSEIIARANKLAPPFVLRPGQKLIIPAGRYHLVAEGETGIAIAAAYGVKWSEVVAINGLDEPFILRRGQRLLLPEIPTNATRTNPRPGRAAFLDIDIDDVLTGGQPAAKADSAIPPAQSQAKPLSPSTPIAEPDRFAGTFAWPVAGPVVARFGPGAAGIRNDGVDIRVAPGTPIKASADGVVAYAGDEIGVYGGLVLIVHGDGFVTAYGHAARLDVVRGQKIRRGQIIGLSGESGQADSPRLHFEIRKNRQPVNPLQYLPATAS